MIRGFVQVRKVGSDDRLIQAILISCLGDEDDSDMEDERVSPIGQVPIIECEDRDASSTFITLIYLFEGAAK